MMDRRAFLAGTGAVILAAPLAAEAQPAGKVYRVAIVFQSSPVSDMAGPEPVHPLLRVFVHALRDLGYVEGRNLVLERRSMEGKPERASDIATELVRLKVDVIVTSANLMTRAAKEATTTVPIVMAGNAAPVELGLVASLARPGGNVTGLSADLGGDIEGKRLELLKEAVPRISRVAFVGPPAHWNLPAAVTLQATARALGLTLFLAGITRSDVAPAFPLVTRERADAMFVAHGPETYVHRGRIIEFAATGRLPASYAQRESVEDGGLMSYALSAADMWRRAAVYVDKILKGAKPADLPVEQPTRFELVINLKTAKALGLTIPQLLLMRADQVIE